MWSTRSVELDPGEFPDTIALVSPRGGQGRDQQEAASRLRRATDVAFDWQLTGPQVADLDADHIVVLHAEKIAVTGNKLADKMYHQHTGYLGNLKSIALGKLLKEHPERVLQYAIKGMLPKNTLGRSMYRKLHVFAGGEHPHTAQQPRNLAL